MTASVGGHHALATDISKHRSPPTEEPERGQGGRQQCDRGGFRNGDVGGEDGDEPVRLVVRVDIISGDVPGAVDAHRLSKA